MSNLELSASQLNWMKPGEPLVNGHVDAEAFTVLLHRKPQPASLPLGLQLRTAEGSWEEVPYAPGCLLVSVLRSAPVSTGTLACVSRRVTDSPQILVSCFSTR